VCVCVCVCVSDQVSSCRAGAAPHPGDQQQAEAWGRAGAACCDTGNRGWSTGEGGGGKQCACEVTAITIRVVGRKAALGGREGCGDVRSPQLR
jgi:hypothetical protein